MKATVLLVSRPHGSRHNSRAGHPAWRRCSSFKYGQYPRSSRLATRAPRSGTYATIHAVRTLERPRCGQAPVRLYTDTPIWNAAVYPAEGSPAGVTSSADRLSAKMPSEALDIGLTPRDA